MFFTPLKVYIITADSSEESSILQDIAVNALNRSIWHKKPVIIPAALDTVTEWMPAGSIQVQGFGLLKVMYNYEADLTEDVIQAMHQVCKTLHAVFKSHPKLHMLRDLDTGESDADLDKIFLKIHREKGKAKLIEQWNQLLNFINFSIENIKSESDANLCILLDEITKSHDEFRMEIELISKQFSEKINLLEKGVDPRPFLHHHHEEMDRVTEAHENRQQMIRNKIKANEDNKLNKLALVDKEAARRFRIFGNKIAKGYGVLQEPDAAVHGSASQTPGSSSQRDYRSC